MRLRVSLHARMRISEGQFDGHDAAWHPYREFTIQTAPTAKLNDYQLQVAAKSLGEKIALGILQYVRSQANKGKMDICAVKTDGVTVMNVGGVKGGKP